MHIQIPWRRKRFSTGQRTFRKFFEEEKAKFVQAYRAKLNQELQTQSEIINERYDNQYNSCVCEEIDYFLA